MAADVRRLLHPRHHDQHGVQPDGRDAHAGLGQADDGRAVADLADRRRPRDRPRGERVQLMREEGRHTHIEWLSTLLLAPAAIATAWSTYQRGPLHAWRRAVRDRAVLRRDV